MIAQLVGLLRSLTDPDKLIYLLSTVITGWYGYLVLFLIVFSESGLLVGFFLPGDSLLFTVGVVAGAGKLNVLLMIVLLSAASILGDGSGFYLGTAGYELFSNPKSGSSGANTSIVPTRFTSDTAARLSFTPSCSDHSHLRCLHSRGGKDQLPAF